MARVTIGGKEYEIPELNFAGLERAWPYVNEAMMTLDAIKGPAAGICIIAAGLMEADHFKPTDFGISESETLGEEQVFERVVRFLKKKIKAKEIDGIRRAVEQINEEAGLEEAELGEPQGSQVERASPSPETAPDTSQSSQPPDVVEETGKP